MNGARLLAIDVGTQSARAIVFDAQGNLLARAQRVFEPTYVSPQAGWAEQDPEVYWNAVGEACRELWRSGVVRPEEISYSARPSCNAASVSRCNCALTVECTV